MGLFQIEKRWKEKGLALCMALCLGMTGCHSPIKEEPNYTLEVSESAEPEVEGMSREDAIYAAMDYMENMTIEEKVGQLFVVNLELLDDTRGNFYEWQEITKSMK